VNAERAQAYGQVMRRLRALGSSELFPHEEEELRETADALLFSTREASDDAVRESLAGATRLVERLVAVGRWQEEPAQQLLRDLEACGPLAAVH
jgi:hypothetical protein